MCKKKCKGPCKGAKKREDEERKRKEEEEKKANGTFTEAIPVFIGRHKAESQDNLRDIHVEGVSIASSFLLENARLILNWGNRYGLVGKNGSGKSTLLQHIAERQFPMPDNLMIVLCESEVEPSDQTALECVLSADKERTALLRLQEVELEKDSPDEDRLNKLQERLYEIDAESAPSRSATILSGLGFTKEMQQKLVKEFSGGWRMRISLAQALMLQPDVLLLDEPTNHLDLESCLWLEDHLSRWSSILVVVSHAQDFLNGVCTKIIHMYKSRLSYYSGNYDQFVKTREELMMQQMKKYLNEQHDVAHIKEFVARFGHGSRASQAKSRIKAMAKMKEQGMAEKPTLDKNLKFRFEDPAKVKGAIVQFLEASFWYEPGKVLYKDLDFGISTESRVALVGPNGVGKSTLLKLIAGDLQPTKGAVTKSPHVRVGRFH